MIGDHDDSEVAPTVIRGVDESHFAAKRPYGDRRPARKLHRRPTFELQTDGAVGLDQRSVIPVDVELDRSVLGRGVGAVLEDPGKGSYWVVEREGRVLGGLLVTLEWSDWRNGCFWWIQSVYVVPGYRRRGVFRALYDHVLARAQSDSAVCGLRLYVERDNVVARNTYSELGMVETPYAMYEEEFDRD